MIAEAMAHARPVLATECGGIPDQVVSGRTGVLVPQHDHEKLTAALRELLVNESGRRRMGRAAWARARSHFDATRLAERVEDVLLEVSDHGTSCLSLGEVERAAG